MSRNISRGFATSVEANVAVCYVSYRTTDMVKAVFGTSNTDFVFMSSLLCMQTGLLLMIVIAKN